MVGERRHASWQAAEPLKLRVVDALIDALLARVDKDEPCERLVIARLRKRDLLLLLTLTLRCGAARRPQVNIIIAGRARDRPKLRERAAKAHHVPQDLLAAHLELVLVIAQDGGEGCVGLSGERIRHVHRTFQRRGL